MKITELTTFIEKQAEKAENLDFCKGINDCGRMVNVNASNISS